MTDPVAQAPKAERSEAAKAALLQVYSRQVRGYSTIISKEPAGFLELCREGILKREPIRGDYDHFITTTYGRQMLEYELLMERLSPSGPTSAADVGPALRHILERLGPPVRATNV